MTRCKSVGGGGGGGEGGIQPSLLREGWEYICPTLEGEMACTNIPSTFQAKDKFKINQLLEIWAI